MTAPTPRTPCASLFFSETQGRNNLSSQWCSDAIHSGCDLVVFLAAIGVFAFQNRDVITVRFSTWNLSEPVAF